MAEKAVYDGKMPSRVSGRAYLHYGFEKSVRNKSLAGKWMIFLDDVKEEKPGLTELDLTWPLLVNLARSYPAIMGVSCTTEAHRLATAHERAVSFGIACCFTSDFTNIDEVRAVAEEIRKTLHYPGILYYLVCAKYDQHQLRVLGYDRIALYKQTSTNDFYLKDDSQSSWVSTYERGQTLIDLAPNLAQKLMEDVAKHFGLRT